MGLQIPLSAGAGIGEVPEDPGLDVTVAVPVTFLPHVDGSLVHPAVDRPVLSSLPVTESDGEATEVPVDDLNTVVRGAGDVEDIGTAGYHLSLHTQPTPRVVNNHIYQDTQSVKIRLRPSETNNYRCGRCRGEGRQGGALLSW